MQKAIFTLFAVCAASFASAVDVAQVVKTLGGDDYAARLAAREELQKAFAAATAPGADVGESSALEASLIGQLSAAELPLESRLYLIRMLELFGSDAAAGALYPLLSDSEPVVRDSARRALVAIPGAQAARYLQEGLARGGEADRAAYVNALATRGVSDSAPAVADLLKSSDPALVAASAVALGKLGNEAAIPALLSARKSATGDTKALIEIALLQIGVDADSAYRLASTGSRGVICAEAFRQLAVSDVERAMQLLKVTLENPELPNRLRFLQAALESDSVPLREAVVAHLSGGSVNDQVVIVTAIGEQGLTVYEAQLLALLPKSEDVLRACIIHALGDVGGDASFESLFRAFSANSKDKNAANALARLKAPAADQKALAAVESEADTATRIASIKILELRNTSGATVLLNRMITEDVDAKLKEAAFKSLESIGDDDSIRKLLQLVTGGGAQAKAAQRSLKRLSANFSAAEYQWKELYYPVIESAENAPAREAVVQILDGVACPSVLSYMKEILLDRSSSLRPAAISALQRWPAQEQLYDADLWISIASDPQVTDKELSMAARSLKKILKYQSHTFCLGQADLLVKIVHAKLPLEYKRELLSVYEDAARHFSYTWLRGGVVNRLKAVENDPQVGDLIKAITSQL